jgi:hypothetical protein
MIIVDMKHIIKLNFYLLLKKKLYIYLLINCHKSIYSKCYCLFLVY